jgi:hypothetical protein
MPHKEGRYLLPIIPFFCIVAAKGFLRGTDWLARSATVIGWRRWTRDLSAPLLILAVLHDVGGWRLPRSNEGIRLAERLRQTGSTGLVGQDLWRLGGHPYLWPLEPVTAISPDLLSEQRALSSALEAANWVALRSRSARTVGDAALQVDGFQRDSVWRGEDYVLYKRIR